MRKPVRSASKEGTTTGPQEATQAGPEASPRTSASPNANAAAMLQNLTSPCWPVCDVKHLWLRWLEWYEFGCGRSRFWSRQILGIFQCSRRSVFLEGKLGQLRSSDSHSLSARHAP